MTCTYLLFKIIAYIIIKQQTFRVRPQGLAEGILYAHSSDQVLYALFPDGTIKWAFDTKSDRASLLVFSKNERRNSFFCYN